MQSRVIATEFLAIFLLAGCSGRTETSTSPPPFETRPHSTAEVSILTPAAGRVVSGATLHVVLDLKGGEIVPQTSTHLTPDKGHIHLLIDGKVVSMAYGLVQDVPVTAGTHLLQAEFVAMDHFPFNPRVIATSVFTVQ